MRILAIILVSLAAALFSDPGQSTPDSYTCSGEMALGFKFHEPTRDWIRGKFETSDFIVVRESGHWVLNKLHSDMTAPCNSSAHNSGEMICEQPGIFTFRVNLDTRRFLYSHYLGYVNGDEHTETPYTEIGLCLKFQ
ncbi:MAG: hypothetical protein QNJ40_09870 [Xanthomonadales bacterium]|nr:hypothetical protein [Xanthomonadales bacterium]